jgi:hypothetical protein
MTDEVLATGTEASTNGGGDPIASDVLVDAEIDGTSTELASALADDKSDESFWSGDVTELEGDDLARYKSFQSDYTKKRMADSQARKAWEFEAAESRETLTKQQADLQQLAVQLQARLAADGTDSRGGGRESVNPMDGLRRGFDDRIAKGEGFEAMVDLVKTLAGETTSVVSEREKVLQARVDDLEGKFSGIETGLAPYRRQEEINAAFDELQASQYQGEFKSPKVRQEILNQLKSPGAVVSDLLESGNVKAALMILGERAIRQVREGQVMDRAKRRTEASSPDSPAASAASDMPKRKSDFDSTAAYLRDFLSRPEHRELGNRLKGR